MILLRIGTSLFKPTVCDDKHTDDRGAGIQSLYGVHGVSERQGLRVSSSLIGFKRVSQRRWLFIFVSMNLVWTNDCWAGV